MQVDVSLQGVDGVRPGREADRRETWEGAAKQQQDAV